MTNEARKQCAKCPWKQATNPHDIPDGYSVSKHRALKGTIVTEGVLNLGELRLMSCHESTPDDKLPCVGWLVNQLGPGNNIGLRMACSRGQVNADVELDGPQHETFEGTLPG